MQSVPSRIIAGCFSLCGFSVSLLMGVAAANSAVTILTRAIFAMLICYVIGRLIGAICQRVVEEALEVDDAAADQSAETDQTEAKASAADEGVEAPVAAM